MGLDFMVYKVKKNTVDAHDEEKAWAATNGAEELAYGRKSWELVDALNVDTYHTYSLIEKKDWDALIKNIKQVEFVIRKLYEYDSDKDMDDEDEANDYNSLMRTYELWHNSVFDRYPTLGYEFSLGYMISFLEADAKVQEAFNDKEVEVWGFASY